MNRLLALPVFAIEATRDCAALPGFVVSGESNVVFELGFGGFGPLYTPALPFL
jgi:hypothetical protein